MNETIPYVTRNLRHLLAAPNLTETQRTIITRTLATLSEEFPEGQADEHEIRWRASVSFGVTDEDISKMSFPILTNGGGR